MILRNELTSEMIEVPDGFLDNPVQENPPTIPVEKLLREGVFQGFADIPEELYHSLHGYYSNSFLSECRRSLAHAKAQQLNPPEPTPSLILGRAFHMAALEPKRFQEKFICGPDVSRATKEWKNFAAAHPLHEVLKPEEWGQILSMVQALNQHPVASKLVRGGEGRAEYSMFWVDPETKLRRKARIDYLLEFQDVLVDLKTTTDASPQAFQRSIEKYGYDMQSAGYLDGYSLLTGRQTRDFVHVCVEKEPPYAVAIYVLDDGTLDLGRHKNSRLLKKCLDAEITGEWPAYSQEIQPIAAAHWAFEAENGDV